MALRIENVNKVHNSIPITGKNGVPPTELFHESKVQPNLKHIYPFGCPVFVLNDQMQAGEKLPKWELRARIGIYLGMLLQHARTVALVLNMNTGHVSRQCHAKFDPRFELVRGSLGNLAPPSKWQEECGFKKSVAQCKSKEESVNRKLICEEPKVLEGEPKSSEGGKTRFDIEGPPEMLDKDDPTKLELRSSARRSRPPVRLGIDEVWMAMELECEKAMAYYVAHEVIKNGLMRSRPHTRCWHSLCWPIQIP